MKKTLLNLAAGTLLLSAAALGLASCTNANDVDDLKEANMVDYSMYVDAIKITGLDETTYDANDVTVTLSYVEKYGTDGKAVWKDTTLDSFKTSTYGTDQLIKGTAFCELDTPAKMAFAEDTQSADAVVKVKVEVKRADPADSSKTITDTIKTANDEFTEFSVAEIAAVKSAYQTKDADLPHRYITVEASPLPAAENTVIGKFSFEKVPADGKYDSIAPYDITVAYIRSNIGDLKLTKSDAKGKLLYATFVYESSAETWGKGAGNFEFGIIGEDAWSTTYTAAELEVNDGTKVDFSHFGEDGADGTGWKLTTKGAKDNNSVSGLEDGKIYTIAVKIDGTNVKVGLFYTPICSFHAWDGVALAEFKKQTDDSWLSETPNINKASGGDDNQFGITCSMDNWNTKFVLLSTENAEDAGWIGTEYKELRFGGEANCKKLKSISYPAKLSIQIKDGVVSAKFN